MGNSIILTPGTRTAIDNRVDRLLRDLGDPEPPLRLEEVRELLRLDLQYYSSTDITWLQDKIHKMKVAGKQVLARPWLMLDVVRKLDLKALILPDRKRILVDAELPQPKQRWSEAHEVIHGLLPWHDGVALGDKTRTLSLSSRDQTENEANYGAGRLLFLGPRFAEQLADEGVMDFDKVTKIKKDFGNSLTTTLWRVVENSKDPVFGLIGKHPQAILEIGETPLRYFIRSQEFARQFPSVAGLDLYNSIKTFCFRRRGPIGSEEIMLQDASGQDHIFFVECFDNSYDTLALGTYRHMHATVVGADTFTQD